MSESEGPMSEERLRAALRSQADEVQPDELGSLDRIRAKTTVARRRRRAAAGVAIAAAAVAVVAASGLLSNGKQQVGTLGTTTTFNTDTTTTTVGTGTTDTTSGTGTSTPSTSTTSTTVPDCCLDVPIVWPTPALATTDPVETATAFASAYIGVNGPVAGSYQGTDSAHGSVAISSASGNLLSTVELFKRDSRWFVLSAHSDGIVVDAPNERDSFVASPLTVSGQGHGFEGHMTVQVRQLDQVIGSGVATGGCCADLAPFSVSVPFSSPTDISPTGAVVVFNDSAMDGSALEFTVVPIRFGTSAATTTVKVFFSQGDQVVSVDRTVPKTQAVLDAALRQLLAGPTDGELASGLSSFFSSATAGLFKSVVLSNGTAVVDFGDLPGTIPNASSSAGSAQLLAQLDATVFQFATVSSVEYRVNGSCDAFFNWLQMSCAVRTR